MEDLQMDMPANAAHLGEADGAGRILLDGQHAPVSYHLTATWEGGGAYGVRIELSAPRDWLLDRGFDREATLVRQNGEKVRVRFENKLGIEDNVSVNLEASDSMQGSIDDVTAKYPELDVLSRVRAAH
jgi:hypothetical protein